MRAETGELEDRARAQAEHAPRPGASTPRRPHPLSTFLTVYLATAGQVEGKTRTQGQRGLWRACASVRMRVCLSVCACVGVSVYF